MKSIMRKSGIFTLVAIVLLATTLTVLTGLPTRHLGRFFYCYQYEGKTNVHLQREQHGFPIVFAKRSISSTDCENTFEAGYGDKGPENVTKFVLLAPDEHHEILDNGYIIGINLGLDYLIWLLASVGLVKFSQTRLKRAS